MPLNGGRLLSGSLGIEYPDSSKVRPTASAVMPRRDVPGCVLCFIIWTSLARPRPPVPSLATATDCPEYPRAFNEIDSFNLYAGSDRRQVPR